MKKLQLLLALTLLFVSSLTYAQKKNITEQKKDLSIALKKGFKPDVYIDGTKYSAEIIDLLDSEKIQSISVVKGEKAKQEYNAPNGVLLITSIKNSTETTKEDSDANINGIDGDPLVFIDGIQTSHQELSKLDPTCIDRIDVLKEKAAMEKYGSKNGVILVYTKKEK